MVSASTVAEKGSDGPLSVIIPRGPSDRLMVALVPPLRGTPWEGPDFKKALLGKVFDLGGFARLRKPTGLKPPGSVVCGAHG